MMFWKNLKHVLHHRLKGKDLEARKGRRWESHLLPSPWEGLFEVTHEELLSTEVWLRISY